MTRATTTPTTTMTTTSSTTSSITRALVLFSALLASGLFTACNDAPPVLVWVDGFAPDNVTFDVEDLGALDDAALTARAKESDIDGVVRVDKALCSTEKGGLCRAALLTVYVNNRGAEPIAPPVVRLGSPEGRKRRLPIAFRAHQIDRGRTGRVRTIVQLYPGEQRLEATLSSSIQFDVTTTPTTPTTPTASTPGGDDGGDDGG